MAGCQPLRTRSRAPPRLAQFSYGRVAIDANSACAWVSSSGAQAPPRPHPRATPRSSGGCAAAEVFALQVRRLVSRALGPRRMSRAHVRGGGGEPRMVSGALLFVGADRGEGHRWRSTRCLLSNSMCILSSMNCLCRANGNDCRQQGFDEQLITCPDAIEAQASLEPRRPRNRMREFPLGRYWALCRRRTSTRRDDLWVSLVTGYLYTFLRIRRDEDHRGAILYDQCWPVSR